MSKSQYLGLELTGMTEPDSSQTFLNWRTNMNGEGSKSNMNIIDKALMDMNSQKANATDVVYNYNRTNIPVDADAVSVNSIYYIQVNDATINLPDSVTGNSKAGWLITVIRSASTAMQCFVPLTIVGVVYQRIKRSSTWGAWQTCSFVDRDSIGTLHTSKPYDMSDIRLYASALYRANQYIPAAESFNSSKWDKFVITDEIQNIEQNAYNMSSLSMFTRIGAVGDSFTAGYLYNKETESHPIEQDYPQDGAYPQIGWPAVMSRLYGIKVTPFAKPGATTKSYIDDVLPSLLKSGGQQLYMLCLGLNDYTKGLSKGVEADLDATTTPDTSLGYYGYIIRSIKTKFPNAKFVICKSFWVLRAGNHETQPYTVTSYYTYISELAETIGSHFDIPVIETLGDPFFCGKPYVDGLHGFHPTAPLYAGMARRLGQLLDKCIIDNPQYFYNFSTNTSVGEPVLYTDNQSLTDAQKTQARNNIGAANNDVVEDKITSMKAAILDSIDKVSWSDEDRANHIEALEEALFGEKHQLIDSEQVITQEAGYDIEELNTGKCMLSYEVETDADIADDVNSIKIQFSTMNWEDSVEVYEQIKGKAASGRITGLRVPHDNTFVSVHVFGNSVASYPIRIKKLTLYHEGENS